MGVLPDKVEEGKVFTFCLVWQLRKRLENGGENFTLDRGRGG